MPKLAHDMAADASFTVGNIIVEVDRVYSTTWRLLEGALATGDWRMARDMIGEQRKLLDMILRQADRLGERGLQGLRALTEQGQFEHYEGVRESLEERLERLAESQGRILPGGRSSRGRSVRGSTGEHESP